MTRMTDPQAAVNGARGRAPQRDGPRRRLSRHHGWVWDGRGDPTAGDARYSIIAGRAATDVRLTPIQLRILLHLGRYNARSGWTVLDQGELADWLGTKRPTVSTALTRLVDLGYVERATQAQTAESYCLYRVAIDPPGDAGGVSATADTPHEGECQPQLTRGVSSRGTPVSAPGGHPPTAAVYSSRAPLDLTRSDPPVVPQRAAGGRRPPATYLPDDWMLPDADREWARQHAPGQAQRIDEQAGAFIDRHVSRRTRRVCWSRAWRDWWRGVCERAARQAPRAALPGERPSRPAAAHTPSAHGVADTGATYEEPRSYSLDSPEGRAWRAELERDGDEAGIVRIERLGRVRLAPSLARRLAAGQGAGSQPVGGSVATVLAASRRAQGATP